MPKSSSLDAVSTITFSAGDAPVKRLSAVIILYASFLFDGFQRATHLKNTKWSWRCNANGAGGDLG